MQVTAFGLLQQGGLLTPVHVSVLFVCPLFACWKPFALAHIMCLYCVLYVSSGQRTSCVSSGAY